MLLAYVYFLFFLFCIIGSITLLFTVIVNHIWKD